MVIDSSGGDNHMSASYNNTSIPDLIARSMY